MQSTNEVDANCLISFVHLKIASKQDIILIAYLEMSYNQGKTYFSVKTGKNTSYSSFETIQIIENIIFDSSYLRRTSVNKPATFDDTKIVSLLFQPEIQCHHIVKNPTSKDNLKFECCTQKYLIVLIKWIR